MTEWIEVDRLPPDHPVRVAYRAGRLPSTNCNRGVWCRTLKDGTGWAISCRWDYGSGHWGRTWGVLAGGRYLTMPDVAPLDQPFGYETAMDDALASMCA